MTCSAHPINGPCTGCTEDRDAALEAQAQAQADVIGALVALFDVDPLAGEPGPAAVIAEALRGSQARLAAKRKQPT